MPEERLIYNFDRFKQITYSDVFSIVPFCLTFSMFLKGRKAMLGADMIKCARRLFSVTSRASNRGLTRAKGGLEVWMLHLHTHQKLNVQPCSHITIASRHVTGF